MDARDAPQTGRAEDPVWTDREAEGQPGTEDQPPGHTAETAVEGSYPPRDQPLVAEDWGTTRSGERTGESLDQRIAREQPDVLPSGAGAETGDRRRRIAEAGEEAALHVERG